MFLTLSRSLSLTPPYISPSASPSCPHYFLLLQSLPAYIYILPQISYFLYSCLSICSGINLCLFSASLLFEDLLSFFYQLSIYPSLFLCSHFHSLSACCYEPGSLPSILSPLSCVCVCVCETIPTYRLRMTSSFYSAANQRQAHGALPSEECYVHKRDGERNRDGNRYAM